MASLITGATGFIGNTLLGKLVDLGENVIAVGRRPHLGQPHRLVHWRFLPEDTEGWNGILEQVSTVYHFAWSSLPQTSNEDPLGDASDNILGTLRLLEAAKKRKGLRLVFASSGGTVYGVLKSVPANEKHTTRPRCAHGVSKLAAEKYLTFYHDLWGLDCIALRIGNAYGPGQKTGRNFGAVSTFATRAAMSEHINIFGDGSAIRDYIYIDDVIAAVIAAGNHRGGPTVMNIGSGVGTSLKEIVDVLRTVCAKTVEVHYVKGRDLDVPISVLDISLAQATLDWRPQISFRDGFRATFDALSKLVTAEDLAGS